MPPIRGTTLAFASFLAFGALLVLYGANSIELLDALDLDYADLGLVGSMLSLGLGVGIVCAGPIIDRFPRRPLYVGACGLVVAACATLGPETSYAALLAHTLVIGFGAGFYETVLNAVVVEDLGDDAPRRLVFVHAGAPAAACATPLLFELGRSFAPFAWHDTFRVAAAAHLLLIVGALAVPMREPARGNTSPERSTSDRPAVSRRRPDDRVALAALCLACFAYVGVESAVSLFVADHTSSSLGLDPARGARTLSAFWGGLALGRLAIGMSGRPVSAGTTALLASVAGVLMVAFGSGVLAAPELAMAGVGFFLGGVFPVMIGLAGIALPSSAGTAVGLAGGLGSVGGFVVPWLTGQIASATDLALALASLGLWLGLLVLAATLAHRRRPIS